MVSFACHESELHILVIVHNSQQRWNDWLRRQSNLIARRTKNFWVSQVAIGLLILKCNIRTLTSVYGFVAKLEDLESLKVRHYRSKVKEKCRKAHISYYTCIVLEDVNIKQSMDCDFSSAST